MSFRTLPIIIGTESTATRAQFWAEATT